MAPTLPRSSAGLASSLALVLVLAGSWASAQPRGAAPAPAASTSAEPPARLSDDAEVARVATHYEAGRYAECAVGVAPLLDPASPRALVDPKAIESARVLAAACYLGVNDAAHAEESLAAAVRQNPRMPPPDVLVYPQPVVDLWLRVRDSLRAELERRDQERVRAAEVAAEREAARVRAERARHAELWQIASRESVVTENQRWIAAIPFGVGQFQNRQPALGFTLLGLESALLATSLATMAIQLEAYATVARPSRDDQQRVYDVFVGSTWGFIGVASLGILHAQLTFVPEFRSTVPRQLPDRLKPASDTSVAPLLAPGVAGVGVSGRF